MVRSVPASFLAAGGLLAGWIAEVPPSLCLHHHMAFLDVCLCLYLPLHKDVFSNGLNWRISVMVHEVPAFPSSMISVQFSYSVMSSSLGPHGVQHTRLPCPSPTPRACSNSCPMSQWCHQPSRPLLSTSPPAFNLSQHQGLFQCVSSSHQVAKVLEFQLQHQSFQWIFRTDFL